MSQKVIIFDLDGTLVDSGANIAAAINHTRASFGLCALEVDFILNQINRDDINAAHIFYGTKSFTNEQRAIFEPYYHDICVKNIALYEKIDFFLEEFKTRGFKMAVATNAHSVFANKMLQSLGVLDYFDATIGADSVSSPKPNPQMLVKALKELRYKCEDFSNVVMVGDSIKDVKAARAIDVASVVVEWGFGDEKPLGDKNLKSSHELGWIIDFFKD